MLGLVLAGGLVFHYVTDDSPGAYAVYTAPTFDAGVTDEQRVEALQSDLGAAASEMAQLQKMADRLQFGKMKAMGQHLQSVADDLQPRVADVEDKEAKALLARGIHGLRTVGEGAEELDQDKSVRGVDDVLEAFEELNRR